MEGVTGVALQGSNREEKPFEYRLALDPTGQRRAICARIAAAVAEARAELYSLQMEHRDLETLFREVSQAPLSNLAASQPGEGGSRDAA